MLGQLEGFHDNSICITRYLTTCAFGCNICASTYMLLDDAVISLVKQLSTYLINYKKYYIVHKLVPEDVDVFKQLLLLANLYSGSPFVRSVVETATKIQHDMCRVANIYCIVWRVVRVINFIVLWMLYVYVLFYASTCVNCNYAIVHITVMIMLNVVFSIRRTYANVTSMIETMISIPLILYTVDDVRFAAICLFMYLCLVTFTHSICDLVSVRFVYVR